MYYPLSIAGKTSVIFNILKHKEQLYTKPTEGIVYCYSVHSPDFDSLSSENIEFVQGIPSVESLEKWCTKFGGLHWILVFDDLIDSLVESHLATEIAIKYSHHYNFSTIISSQNIFFQGKGSRTQSLNSHYIILTRTCRDLKQINYLGSQIFPNQTKAFLAVYKDCMDHPIANQIPYLFISCHPLHTKRTCQLLTNIFPPYLLMVLYQF